MKLTLSPWRCQSISKHVRLSGNLWTSVANTRLTWAPSTRQLGMVFRHLWIYLPKAKKVWKKIFNYISKDSWIRCFEVIFTYIFFKINIDNFTIFSTVAYSPWRCPRKHFSCSYNCLISDTHYVCNGNNDCAYGRDEHYCDQSVITH